MFSYYRKTALLCFFLFAIGISSPLFRLVSGERGVILSIDNITKEPTVQVELIDGNLAVNILGSSVDSALPATYKFGKGSFADSLLTSNSNGVAQLEFFNFKPSHEKIQKKFTGNRFLLLLSGEKTTTFDSKIFLNTDNLIKPKVSDISIFNRDGLEFVSIKGSGLGNKKVTKEVGFVLFELNSPLKKGFVKTKFPTPYITDSLVVNSNGLLKLSYRAKEGVVSVVKTSDTAIEIVISDLREKDIPTVMSFSNAKSFKYPIKVSKVSNSDNSFSKKDSTKLHDDKKTVVYLIKDNVNVRRSTKTTDASNIIGKFAIGTRFISDKKDGSWYRIILESGEFAWVNESMAFDSIRVTSEQWDAINSVKGNNSKPLVDEFNSPGKDPLLTNKSNGAFSLDSVKKKAVILNTDSSRASKQASQIKPYKKLGRDPFLPLTSTDFVKPKLPKVDRLSLVGVIYDPRDGIALFDELVDGKNISFSMRVGETVENGKLLKIYERKVVFLMQESDFTYTIEKELLVKKE